MPSPRGTQTTQRPRTHVAGTSADRRTASPKGPPDRWSASSTTTDRAPLDGDRGNRLGHRPPHGQTRRGQHVAGRGEIDGARLCSQSIDRRRITYCVAAGNSADDASYYSPASVQEAITVEPREAWTHGPASRTTERARHPRPGRDHHIVLVYVGHGHEQTVRHLDGDAARGGSSRALPGGEPLAKPSDVASGLVALASANKVTNVPPVRST